MSIIALVCDVSEARPVVTWAARFAAAIDTDLIIFSPIDPLRSTELAVSTDGEEQFADSLGKEIHKVIETVVRTRKARKGRIPRYAISLRRITDPDPVATTISRVRVESSELFVAAGAIMNGSTKQKTISQQVAARVSCDTVLLYSGKNRSVKAERLLVAVTDGSHDKTAIELGAHTTAAAKGSMVALAVEEYGGDEAVEVSQRELRSIFRDLNLPESPRLQPKTVHGENRIQAIASEANECDLLILGANVESNIPQLIEATGKPTIALVSRAKQLAFGRRSRHAVALLPRLNPSDYADLYEKLQSGSRWNIDFMLMLSLASGIATLGLLQSSPAVVIGSMLLAPLMTPMIGMGLALNQGNARLAYTCFRSISRGFLAGLAISALVGVLTPGSDITPEVIARTSPNILDLLIAVFSGMAAAYALARPSLAGTIAGVAIATALVPPTCAAGICIAYGQYEFAVGAAVLLIANVLAIILAAAITFRAMGLNSARNQEASRLWVSRAVVGLTICFVAISIPLLSQFVKQIHEGLRVAPMALAVTNATKEKLLAHVKNDPGVEILLIGRPGIPREADPIDVGIIISSERQLSRSYGEELAEVVRQEMQNPDLRVWVECVANNWASPPSSPPKQTIAP